MQAFLGFLALVLFIAMMVAGIFCFKVAMSEVPASMPNLFTLLFCLGVVLLLTGIYSIMTATSHMNKR